MKRTDEIICLKNKNLKLKTDIVAYLKKKKTK